MHSYVWTGNSHIETGFQRQLLRLVGHVQRAIQLLQCLFTLLLSGLQNCHPYSSPMRGIALTIYSMRVNPISDSSRTVQKSTTHTKHALRSSSWRLQTDGLKGPAASLQVACSAFILLAQSSRHHHGLQTRSVPTRVKRFHRRKDARRLEAVAYTAGAAESSNGSTESEGELSPATPRSTLRRAVLAGIDVCKQIAFDKLKHCIVDI